MAIIALKAWYLPNYEPIADAIARPADLRLSRNSLLKSGLRADFLDDRATVQQSPWFQRYLEGEVVEFYLEGSGTYAIANIDLISQELYFTKQESTAILDPVIFLSRQTVIAETDSLIQETLNDAIAQLNPRSRLLLRLEVAQRPTDSPLRLSTAQLRQIRKSLLYVADITPITQTENTLIPSPQVCVELGFALQNKRTAQILLLQQNRLEGQLPFDLSNTQQLRFTQASELQNTLPNLLETLLSRYKLLA
ncbi:MAG: hypothetical protein SAJ12_11125 [Jaaginema sp. PMC 1079.18]|nr:hypothetical protein [Jaaginema sp. PMC 1080.18]MEC4851554.1 hypothetical protein [Jaaginema sp. PMC 1079.18]MEC4865307.1 hypothetical protein [Jaaginema sp. PMC 1078.18]